MSNRYILFLAILLCSHQCHGHRKNDDGGGLFYGLAAVVGGIGLVAVAPFALTAAGFTSVGIAGCSVGSAMMSTAAIANGGGIAAGGVVAVLQSAGAVGVATTTNLALGTAGAVAGVGVAKLMDE